MAETELSRADSKDTWPSFERSHRRCAEPDGEHRPARHRRSPPGVAEVQVLCGGRPLCARTGRRDATVAYARPWTVSRAQPHMELRARETQVVGPYSWGHVGADRWPCDWVPLATRRRVAGLKDHDTVSPGARRRDPRPAGRDSLLRQPGSCSGVGPVGSSGNQVCVKPSVGRTASPPRSSFRRIHP